MNSQKMDKYFPQYHFRPARNWMNDPNGLIWYNDHYHMFYQHNPGADTWGDIHWGHAVSDDLIHWEEKNIAMDPSYEDGEVHCYSGCCVQKENQVYAFYTSIGEGERGPETGAQQWSALAADDDLTRLIKHRKPALGQELNAPYPVTMWRDPFVWREEQAWYMLLSGTLEGKGTILLYSSEDLETWKRESVFFQSNEYELIECPNILKFGDRYVLLYSPLEAIRYVVGRIDPDTLQFVPESPKWNGSLDSGSSIHQIGSLDPGGIFNRNEITDQSDILECSGIFDYSVGKKGFYASNFFLNLPDKRYIAFGCLFEGDRLASSMQRGWAGMQSLPREVSLENGQLKVRPAEECLSLRKQILARWPVEKMQEQAAPKTSDLQKQQMTDDRTEVRSAQTMLKRQLILQARSVSCELVLHLLPGDGAQAEIELFASADGHERTVLTVDYDAWEMRLNRDYSTLAEDITTEALNAPLPRTEGEVVLRIFIDHSAVEIFYEARQAAAITMTARVFPILADSTHVRVEVSDPAILTDGWIYELEL